PFSAYQSSRVPAYTRGAPGLAASRVRTVAQPGSSTTSARPRARSRRAGTPGSVIAADLMVLAPARQHVLGDVQQVEDARHHEVDQVVDGLRLVIEARRGRHYD